MIRTLDKMGEEIPLGEPWKAPKAVEWDSMTVKEFFDKACWTPYAKKRMAQVYNDAMAAGRTQRYVSTVLSVVLPLKMPDKKGNSSGDLSKSATGLRTS